MKDIKEYFIAFLKVIGAIMVIIYLLWSLMYCLTAPDLPLYAHILTVGSFIVFATIAVKKGL